MNSHEELDLKKEFQLERIILFSDAVFAIIVTIMVIDLKLPETIREASNDVFNEEFKKLYVRLLAYGFSFFFVAMFWTRHVKLFGYLKDFNRSVLTFNLIFLFCASLFPFAVTMLTGFKSLRSVQAHWGFLVYFVVIMICVLSFTILTGYLIKNKETLCYGTDTIEKDLKWRAQRINIYMIPVAIIAVVIMTVYNIESDYIGYVMAFYGALTGIIAKRFYPSTVTTIKPTFLSVFSRNAQKKSRRAKLPAGE